MKIYIAIWKDRHSDTTAHPFTTKCDAIDFARAKANDYCRDPDDYNEIPVEGWAFHVEYSCESDCIYVVETEIDKNIIK